MKKSNTMGRALVRCGRVVISVNCLYWLPAQQGVTFKTAILVSTTLLLHTYRGCASQ